MRGTPAKVGLIRSGLSINSKRTTIAMHTHATPRTPAPKAKPAQPRHNHFRVLARPSLLERIESRTGIDAPGLFIIAMSLVTLVAMGLLIHLFRD